MRPRVDLRSAVNNTVEHVPTAMTFEELVRAYCAVRYDGADLRMRKWVDALGDKSAWEVTSEQIVAAAETMLAAGYKPSTVNRDTSQVGSIYRWAIEKQKMAPKGFVSPTRGIERYDEEMRVVEISNVEIDKLLAGAHAFRDRRFAVYVRLLYETGCRKGEVLERVWKDVDLDAGTILCPVTKTGRPRILHFSPATADLMRRVWTSRHPDALLFEGRVRGSSIDYRAQWSALTKAIGRPDLHQHDMRHHRAASLLRSGTTIAVAAQALGHSSLILQRRYGYLETAHLKAAIQSSWAS